MSDRGAGAPRVSVIMAAYNAASTIEASIKSVLAQTLLDWELVIVDDASEDNTLNLLAEFLRDERIRIIVRPTNEGGASARNIAVRASLGEYIAIQDADDIAHPHRLEKQLDAFLRDPRLSVVSSRVREFGAWGGPELGFPWPLDHAAIDERRRRGRSAVPDCASMFTKSAYEDIGGYDESLLRAYDLDFYLRLRNPRFQTLPEPLLDYRTVRPITLSYCMREGRYHERVLDKHLRPNTRSGLVASLIRKTLVNIRSGGRFAKRRLRESQLL